MADKGAASSKKVWGAHGRPAIPRAVDRPGKQLDEKGSKSTPSKKSAVRQQGGCQEGCCDAGGADSTSSGRPQGKSYLRRYGLLRQGPGSSSSWSKDLGTKDDGQGGAEMVAMGVVPDTKGAACELGSTCTLGGACCKGKEKDLEEGSGLHDTMRRWGLEVSSTAVGGVVVMDAAAGVAVECCRLCLEAEECCQQLCCAAMCCLRELKTALLENSVALLSPTQKDIHTPVPSNPPTTVHLNLSGLDCADCSVTVERTLKRNPAVVSVAVSAMTNKAEVTFDSRATDEEAIIKDIRSLGFGAEMAAPSSTTRLVLRVAPPNSGISEAVAELECQRGIVSAVYKRKKRLLTVDYDPKKARIRTAVEALEASGFSVSVVRDDQGKSGARKQVRSWMWRFWLSALLSVPVFLISFLFPYVPTASDAFDDELTQGLSVGVFACWVLATPIQFVIAWPLYGSSFRALWYGHKANMDTLVVLSTLTAYTYSVIAVIVAMAGSGFKGESFFETSAILLTLIILGRYLEALARGKACDVVGSLRREQATTALLLRDDAAGGSGEDDALEHEREVDVELIQQGDVIKVLPGGKVAVDGVVVLGVSSVDESLVTGESLPVAKSVGSLVLGGTINQHGTLHVLATKTASESTLAEIGRLVEDAQAGKPRLQRIADVIASYFVPVILLLALVVLALWISVTASGVVDTDGDHWVPFSLQFAIAVLVVSCPCSIGLAVPLAVIVACGVGAKQGLVIKSGAIIETCRRINTVVFDKTGTLTTGRLSVVDHRWLVDKERHADLLSLIGSAEKGSEHVLAKAVVRFVESQGVTELTEPQDFTAVPGRGLSARVLDRVVLVGNRQWMQDNGVVCEEYGEEEATAERMATKHESEGRTVVWAAVDGRAACMLALEDSLRPEARGVVRRLQRKGAEVWLLSGDQQRTVGSVARQLGIPEAHAVGGLVPEDKVDRVRQLQQQRRGPNGTDRDEEVIVQRVKRRVVAMVGDGVNDAPSLAQADVGMAVGGGTDIALDAGDVILMRNDLRDVLVMIHLARCTRAVIVLNFAWAFLYNAIAIPLAAGVLYPGTRFVIPPAAAGLSEILSSLPIILFSFLLRLYRPKHRLPAVVDS